LRRYFRVAVTPNRRLVSRASRGCAFSVATQSLQCVGRLILSSDAMNLSTHFKGLIRRNNTVTMCCLKWGSGIQGAGAAQGALGGCPSFLIVEFLPILKQAKGWRRFRGALAPFVRLTRSHGSRAKMEGTGIRAKNPRTGDKTDDRSMRDQEFAPARKSPNRFRALSKRTGTSPSCLAISHDLCLCAFSLQFAMRGGSGRFPSAREAPFVQRGFTMP
jgi:hypothetical protein